MYIVFMTHVFPIKGKGMAATGAGNYVANMAQIMAQHGHKVTVVTEAKEEEILVWNGIEIRYINSSRGFRNSGKTMSAREKAVKNVWRSIWYCREISKINKKEKIDLVQSVNSYGIALFKKSGIPYLVRISDYIPLISGAKREVFEYEKCVNSKKIDDEIQFIAIKRADKIIAPSVLVKKLAKNKIGREVEVIESPVFFPEESDFAESDIKPDKYFLTYGVINYRKSIHVLAEIIDKILDEYPDIKYVIIGSDGMLEYKGGYIKASELLYSKIVRNRDRFIFKGEIFDRSRLFSIIKNSCLCILPTRFDNLPNTVLESMALGKIVISSDGTSVEQLIVDGQNGFLTEIDNAEELFQKIKYAMQLSDEEKRKIESRAKDRVKDLTPEKVYAKMMDVYMETIEDFHKKKYK